MAFPTLLAPIQHLPLALARLALQYRGKTNVQGVFAALCPALDELETVFSSLLTAFDLGTAADTELAVLERTLGQPKLSSVLAERLLYLRARILINRSSGTVDELLAIFALLVPTVTLRLVPYPPASAILYLSGEAITPATSLVLFAILDAAKVAGVRIQMNWMESAPASTFTFDAGPGLDVGHLAGSL